ncbi:hypothetical protein ASPFODRAFT_54175, partial [Aspergillus luchuensis CBS 106.47]
IRVLTERDSTKPSTRRGLKFRGWKEDCGHKIMQGRCGFCRRHFKNSTTYDSYVDFNPPPWPELDVWSRVSGIDL